jgi:hypothetical protein
LVMIGDERYARSSEDDSRSWTVMDTMLGVDYSKDLNPHESTKSLDIYQVPSGKKSDAIWFPMTTAVSESFLLVATG